MKKLGKLSINPSKVMKNEELVRLKGGYGGGYEGGYGGGGCTPGAQGSTYWICCVGGEAHTFYKDNAKAATAVCELYHGEDACAC